MKPMNAAFSKIRISSGTASVLGLNRAKSAVNPETAYVLVGEKCTGGCLFCAQNNSVEKLSRVVWPEFDIEVFLSKVSEKSFPFKNVCIQVTKNKNSLKNALELLKEIRKIVDNKVSISVSADFIHNQELINEFFQSGLSRLGIAIDCVSSDKYSIIKNGNYNEKLNFLLSVNSKYPGRISTHAIAGLGETAFEIMNFIDIMIKNKIETALFAYTPVKNKNTNLLLKKSPEILYYRLVQACFYLMKKNIIKIENIEFDENEFFKKIKIPDNEKLRAILKGDFLKTTGCRNCNRPFYNEKVNSLWYNFPRSPYDEEIETQIQMIENYFN
ncbi:MAG: radical SAM protein [Candidatus Muiribacteriota bacterium]